MTADFRQAAIDARARSEEQREAYRQGRMDGYRDGWTAACLKLRCEVGRFMFWLDGGAARPIGTRCDPADIKPPEGGSDASA